MPTRGDAGHEGCRTGRMQDKWNTGEVICWTGGIRDRGVAGQLGYRKGKMQDR